MTAYLFYQHLLLLPLLFMFTKYPVRSMSTSTNQNRRFILHWFRHGDLRVHDNPALVHSASLLTTAVGSSSQPDVIIPIFCFDTKIFGNQAYTSTAKTIKCGPRRAKFIIESVLELRNQLQTKCKSQLLVACGDPSQVLNHVADYIHNHYKTDKVRIVCQEEVASEEKQAVKDVQAVFKNRFPLSSDKLLFEIWGSTMYDRYDLPYDTEELKQLPDGFTPFRTTVEQKAKIKKPLPVPKLLPFPNDWPTKLTNGEDTIDGNPNMFASTVYMPTLQELGYTDEQIEETEQHDPRGVMVFHGGETAGLARVQHYIWEKDLLKDYFDTRNGMIGADYSTKFSPWLAHGCVSPRHIVSECSKYESERVKNKSTYWVVFELLWRDYCKFFTVKHQEKIFRSNGILAEKASWKLHRPNFEAWKEGRTGYPLVDANMREMKATGFMSNRGRQNVASFLAFELQYDWRYGGDWFESNLIDYDVYSNWVVRKHLLELMPFCHGQHSLIIYFLLSCRRIGARLPVRREDESIVSV
jgi:deoxyribodipyrimidine photo-lyase